MKQQNIIFQYGLLLACFVLSSMTSWAQPDWSVNASDYQYTMTITGIGLFQCQESIDQADIVAAFIDGECRGVQSFGVEVDGKMLSYLTVYDNMSQGNEVSFKMYDASEDKVYDAVFPAMFEENAVLGSHTNPHEFKTDYVLTELILENTTLYDYDKQGTVVTPAFTINEFGDTSSFMIDFVEDSLGIDNEYFSVSGSELLLEIDVDYKNKQSYQIHLVAISDAGCEVDGVFIIEVVNTNIAPTGLVEAVVSINENEQEGTVVTELVALDESPNDVHTFELVGNLEEWPDHAFFQISGTELQSAAIFDYEERNGYLLQIKITDRVGNTYVDTLAIDILDVIEFDDLKTGNVITPNGDGLNDFFEIPNVDLFADYELCIYNDNGNRVYRKERYQNNWEGRNKNGARLPNGTYYFTLREKDNEQNAFKGSIHLYRTNNY